MPTFAVFRGAAVDDETIARTWLSCPWLRVQSIHRERLTADFDLRCRRSPSNSQPSLRFPYPSTTSDADSDPHRVYLTRLRYAFRLSQSLDVLIPPSSSQPCFMLVPPVGLRPSEVSPPRQPPTPLDAGLPSCPFFATLRYPRPKHLQLKTLQPTTPWPPTTQLQAPKRSSSAVR
jgi:hypothetical protein